MLAPARQVPQRLYFKARAAGGKRVHLLKMWALVVSGGVALGLAVVAAMQVHVRPEAIPRTTQAMSASSALTKHTSPGNQSTPSLVRSTAASVTTAATATFRIDPYTAYAVPTGPRYAYTERVVAGDVTGDGRTDVVVTTVGLGTFDPDLHAALIFVQNADGSLASPIRIPYLDIPSRTGLELADLDSNGTLEIIVGHSQGLTVIARSDAGFSATLVASASPAWYLGVVDADQDGKPDIVAQTWSDGAWIYFGDGQRGFDQRVFIPSGPFGYNTVDVQDFTRDGFKDLIITNGQGASKVWVYPVDRVTGLGAPIVHDLGSQFRFPSFGLAVGDLDKDGRPDMVLTDVGNVLEQQPPGIRILYTEANGQLGRSVKLPAARGIGAVAVADLDGNGHDDIVGLQNSWNVMQFHLQQAGGFQAPVEMTTTTTPWFNAFYFDNSLAVSDVNSDGCLDILVADMNSGLLVYPGRNCAAPRRIMVDAGNPRRASATAQSRGTAGVRWHGSDGGGQMPTLRRREPTSVR